MATIGDAWRPDPNLSRAVASIHELFRQQWPAMNPVMELFRTNPSVATTVLKSFSAAMTAQNKSLMSALAPQFAPMQQAILDAAAVDFGPLMRSITTSAAFTESLKTSRIQLQLLQLRGVMDTLAEVEPSADQTAEPVEAATPQPMGTVARPRDWGISKKQAVKILAALLAATDGVMDVDGLIRELVGGDPSPVQTLYWSAGIVAMTIVLVVLAIRPSDWDQTD